MPPADGCSPRVIAAAVGLILLAGATCYANSLTGEFVFDDVDSIVQNESIRSLDSFAIWNPPPSHTVSGRPLLNLSLALNYAVGEYDVLGYHLVNVLIHLLAAVVLFFLVRGTLLRPRIPDIFRRSATGIGLASALVWVVHPLQTEVVSYVIQRCESLAAVFFLLTLYSLLRGVVWEERARRWYVPASRHPSWVRHYQKAAQRASRHYLATTIWCVLGVLSKEVMVVAPVVAFLYDRTFLSGSFRETLRQRCWVHARLFSTWLLLGFLIFTSGSRSGTVGFNAGVSPFQYAAAQSMWILHYIQLSIWPEPLVFDYGVKVAPWNATTQLTSAVILVLLGLTIVAVVYRPAIGFLLVAFFLVLAPSSSFVPVATQVAAERRMYLPLAPLILLTLLAVVWLGSRLPVSTNAKQKIWIVLLVAWIVPIAVLTHLRNRDYHTALALWTDTVAKVPSNSRARVNLGQTLFENGEGDQAIATLRTAVALDPDSLTAQSSLGIALIKLGCKTEAVAWFRELVDREPNSPIAMVNLAAALQANGEFAEAIEWYRKSLRLEPNNPEAHFHLGQSLLAAGREEEAAASFHAAIDLDPRFSLRLSRELPIGQP